MKDVFLKIIQLLIIPILGFIIIWFISLLLPNTETYLLVIILMVAYTFFNAFFIGYTVIKKKFVWDGFFLFIISILSIISIFATIYNFAGIYDSDGKRVSELAKCFYFSLITWTTVGYGDIHPGEKAQLFAGIEAMVGYLYMAILVGLITSAIQQTNNT